MPFQLIPLNTDPNQTFQVPLNIDGAVKTLVITLRYNETAGYWVATIKDNQQNLILDSVPFVTGLAPAQNFLGQFAYLKIGSAYIVNASGVTALDFPNNQDLGSDFVLVWGDTQEA